MPPVKMSEREQKLALVTAAVVIFYVFFQFLITPEWDRIVKLQGKLQNARMELEIAEGKIRILEQLKTRSPEKAAISRVPREERPLAVLRALAHATSKSQLNLISVKPILGENKDEFKFDVVCTGNYQSLYSFLKILHGLDIIVMIDSLRVSGGGSKKPDLHMKIVLTAYF